MNEFHKPEVPLKIFFKLSIILVMSQMVLKISSQVPKNHITKSRNIFICKYLQGWIKLLSDPGQIFQNWFQNV